ncbi:apoptosis-inducing factor 1, mitochondrial [Culex quinquefasciatus]|uniref:Apoptosis-inducing factor 1, mitochondrial n=1 Tax=Culex quinquefasciatus TaxID=7176 RepID=B0W7M7_CULQU|nr:apoptosis-inducing factor 1, mitochondrial [Culex quinquefasciatus]|eukprot:XP_001844711.1 apoptosis-inducing factor 1, mitochondrial [Culex quinquefasciatus]
MLAVSRLTIGQLRPRVAAIGTKKYFAGGTTSGGCTYSRRWFSKKVNDSMAKELAARRRKMLASGGCYSPPYEGCSSEGVAATGGCRIGVPLIGEDIQYGGGDCGGKRSAAEEPDLNKTSPACPPPPPPSNDNTAYIIGAIALTAGGLGLAYKMGLFDGEPTVQQVAPELTTSSGTKSKQRYPASSKDLPGEVPYLLIGGGTASFAAFRAIKGHDAKAKVLVISNEPEMPYMRPPLSKELWFNPEKTDLEPLKFKQWNGVERSIYYEPDDFYIDPTKLAEAPNGGVAIARGYEVQRIDVVNRKVVLTDGTEIKYGECLLATGARPKNLPVFESAPLAVKEHLTMFKSVSDFEELSQKLKPGSKVAVVGGGFLGSEMSCALAKFSDIREKNLEVYQLFHEEGNMGKILPEYLSQWTTDRVREEGVKVWPKTQIKAVEVQDKKLKLTLTDDSSLVVDHAIVAVGSEPNTDLAKTSNLEVDPTMGGFVVDAELRARSHLYVAGDAACFYDPKLGRRRVEHHDHAVVSGRLAGENMAGKNKPYIHQSMFWSDLGPKIGYEAIGIIDSALPTVAVFAKASPAQIIPDTSEKLQAANATIIPASATQTPSNSSVLNHTSVVKAEAMPPKPAEPAREDADDFNKGVIFYLRDEKVVGVLLWNIFNRIGTARKIVAQHTRYDDLNEVAKLFNLHDRPEAEEVEEEAKN